MDQEACIGPMDEEEPDEDLNGPPMSAAAYLKQVRQGRKECPDVVKVEVTQKLNRQNGEKKKWEATSMLKLKNEVFQTNNELIAPKKWQMSKSELFRRNRERIRELRQSQSVTPLKFKKPNFDDEEAWHELLLEKCRPELESSLPNFPNHIGTPPTLSVVFGIPPRLVNDLIGLLVEWSDSEGLTRPIREWLYALLLVVELPLLPNVHAALRTISTNSKRARSCLAPHRVEEANEFSLFIAIVSYFFEQKDLRDHQ